MIPYNGLEVVPYHQRSTSLSPTFSQGSFNLNSNLAGNQPSSTTAHGTEEEIDVSVNPLEKNRIGLPSKIFVALLALLLCLAALVLGWVLGLASRTIPQHTYSQAIFRIVSVAPLIRPIFRQRGAFNGSGIAFAGSALRSTEKGRSILS